MEPNVPTRIQTLSVGDDLVDQAIFHSLLRGHEVIAFRIPLDNLQWFAGIIRQHLVQVFFDTQVSFRVDFNVGNLSLHSAHGLMDHDFAVWQRQTFPLAPEDSRNAPIEAAIPMQIVKHRI